MKFCPRSALAKHQTLLALGHRNLGCECDPCLLALVGHRAFDGVHVAEQFLGDVHRIDSPLGADRLGYQSGDASGAGSNVHDGLPGGQPDGYRTEVIPMDREERCITFV